MNVVIPYHPILTALCIVITAAFPAHASTSFADVVRHVQPKVVKIFGAGGLRGLESYQSGFLISNKGHVLTVWSHVLDTEAIAVVTDDGRRFRGELIGSDPRLEVALLKIDANDQEHFDLRTVSDAVPGDHILAFGNLFGVAMGNEQTSVMHGNIATRTQLAARRGAYRSRYQGPVYVLDAMTNNPGAAGGVLTDRHGELLGLLGKELRNAQDNTWLNYAIPISEITASVKDILSGKILPRTADDQSSFSDNPHTLSGLGIVLVPNILDKTPPFIERVVPHTAAAHAGLRPDDLVLFVGQRGVPSINALQSELRCVHRADELRLNILRGDELLEVVLR